MALWGKTDEVNLTGTVATTVGSENLVGTGTAFLTVLRIGDVVKVGANLYVVKAAPTTNLAVKIRPNGLANASGVTAQRNLSPKYLSDEQARTEVTRVTTAEAKSGPNRANGVKTPGWVLYKEYGTGRKRVEVLVPFKSA